LSEPTSHILVVDDERLILALLKRILEQAGHRVTTSETGAGMRQTLADDAVDLILLDVRLRDSHGFSLAREVADRRGPPVIFVTGVNDVSDKVLGFETGADDYITKPFDQRELLARVKAVLRRGTGREEATAPRRMRFAGFTLDLHAHTLHAPDGSELELTGFELSILGYLARHPHQVLSREAISRAVSGKVRAPGDRTIDVLVSKLRRKLGEAAPRQELIQTVRGVGYKLVTEVETADTPA